MDSVRMRPIEVAAARIAGSSRVVAFTGAGVSAESGLDTFRDAGGLWDRFDPAEVATSGGWLEFLVAKPWEGIELLQAVRDAFGTARPNAAHIALAEAERAGRLRAVITQNVDGLHRAAGSQRVIELHGSLSRRRCLGCNRTEEISVDQLLSEIDSMIGKLRSFLVNHPAHLLPRCACGALVRPDFVAFGEAVQELDRALAEARTAEVMVVCGTSGVVYPAASLPEEAKSRGAFIVEVDPQRTELSHLADVRIPAPAGEALPELVGALRRVSQAR